MTWLITAQGILLPEDVVHSDLFGVLAAFVALNTVMYVALAIAKALPKLYPRDWLPRRYERAETRSIHPDAPA
jgi:hypothetical protein